MAGRNAAKEVLGPVAGRPVVYCATVGCEQPARRGFNLCEPCETEQRQRASTAFCESQGLRTVEAKREYCKRLARSFGRGPSFETWAKNLTQSTVDLIERMDGRDSKSLERLRGAGVIDGRNKLIPLDARKVAADAYLAERARLIAQAEGALANLSKSEVTP